MKELSGKNRLKAFVLLSVKSIKIFHSFSRTMAMDGSSYN